MPALESRKRTEIHTQFSSLCEGACVPSKVKSRTVPKGSKAQAVRVAYLCGRPAAGLCARCAKDWERWYVEFGGGE